MASVAVAQPQQPPAPVVVAPVVADEVMASQTFVGTVMPTRFATIGSAVDGRVVERPFEEGDRVEAGQKLAQLLTDTIALELAAAEAELELRQQQLAELKNGSRPEEITQAKARMDAAAARQKFLDARRKRIQKMYRGGSAATQDELDEAIATAIEAEQLHVEARAAYELAVAGPRQEQIAQAEAQVAIQKAVVERLGDQLTKHTIISRFAGYVVAEHTEVGQWVSSGDPVADVAALDEVEVVVQVVERSVPFVRVGSEVRVEVPAIAEGSTFAGTVVTTVPQADVRARTFPVKVRVKNQIGTDGPLLKAGMYARAVLPVGAKQKALLVPKDAIVLGGPRPVVMVVDMDGDTKKQTGQTGQTGTVRPLPVELGVAKGHLIQLIGDVTAGQLVVVQGNERLRPGQAVKISRVQNSSSGLTPKESVATETRRTP